MENNVSKLLTDAVGKLRHVSNVGLIDHQNIIKVFRPASATSVTLF